MNVTGGIRAMGRNMLRNYAGNDRGGEYAELLAAAAAAGYEMLSLAHFHALAARGALESRRVLALRHDVDIRDQAGNEAFYDTELAVGARSTFYFRRSTAGSHRTLIERLLADDFEVGYHYEESATVARRAGLTSRAEVETRTSEIHALFLRQCADFRARWNPALTSVASHGDWINRRLGFANHAFVTPALLRASGLEFEAYGDDLLGRVDAYISDVAAAPARWSGDYGLAEAIRDGRTPICLLTHERRWHVNRVANFDADCRRVGEGLDYRWRMTRHQSR